MANPILPQLFPYEVQDVAPQQEIPWNVSLVNAPSFWQKTKGAGAIVAVVDTGIDACHPEFEGRIILAQNFTRSSSKDEDGHGTHVAGIIAGKTTGIAPEAKVIALKVFGEGDGFQFQDAFRWLVKWNEEQGEENRIAAVNCSWGGPYSPMVHYFIRKLNSQGTVVVVSAGNAGDGRPDTDEMFNWPGFLYEPITVGAVNKDATAAKYSSSYDGIDLGAPGTEVYSAWPGGGYKLLSGTSMAAPHVTGALALIYAAWKQREGRWPTGDEAEKVLFRHVRKVPIHPNFVGEGLLDLTFDTRRWPLYRVQTGAYYYKAGADRTEEMLKAAGFSTYQVKY